MVYLIWSLLNLFLILSFFFFAITLIVKGRKYLKTYSRPFVIFVLIFGSVGFLNSANKRGEVKAKINQKPSKTSVLRVKEGLSTYLSLTLIQDIETGEINQEFSSTNLHGLVLGLKWNHLQVLQKNGVLQVEGWYDWYLMGNRVFSNFETYSISEKNSVLR